MRCRSGHSPAVDELVQLYTTGVFLSRTAARTAGRLVRVAVVPLVCDLPALRKVAGFASHSSNHFCSFCYLKKSAINQTRERHGEKGRCV